MRELRRLAWSAALAVAATSPAFAQTGGNLGTASSQSAAIGPTSATAASNGTTSAVGSSTPAGSTSSVGSATPTSTFKATPTFTAPSVNTPNNNVQASNFLGNYFGNVYYQGSTPNNVPAATPGGFGRATYTATATTTRTTRGAAGGALTAGNDNPGQIAILPRQIAYRAQVQFKLPAGGMLPQLQTDIRSAIANIPTDLLAKPGNVSVEVDGRTVVIRGSVQDEEEYHTVEGLVRLTPGVGAIRNELAFPR